MNSRIILTSVSFILFLCCISLEPASAQAPDSAKKWHVLTDIYLMAPYMNGETGVSDNIVAPVDATPGDIFDKLKMAAMLYIEVQHGKWPLHPTSYI